MSSSEEAEEEDRLSDDSRKVLIGMVMQIFEHWEIIGSDKAELLGLPQAHKSATDHLDAGDAIGMGGDAEKRVGLLLGIHGDLRTLFPHNPALAHRWMTSPNLAFEGMTPVAMVQERGLIGLLAIRSYLQHAIYG